MADPNVYPVTAEFERWFSDEAKRLKVTSKHAECAFRYMHSSLQGYEHGEADVSDLLNLPLHVPVSHANRRRLDALSAVYKDLLLQILHGNPGC